MDMYFLVTSGNHIMQHLHTTAHLIALFLTQLWNYPTPWCSVFLEKLIVIQLIKKFSSFYGNWRFITLSTRTLSWAN